MSIEQPNVPETLKGQIKLSENKLIVKALNDKLLEYKERLGAEMKEQPYKAPEQYSNDTVYKIAVLDELLKNGEVNTQELSRELKEKYGFINIDDFDNACGVIEDYNETGGKNNSGGTGFKIEQEYNI
jgi:hypothetical protein